MFGRLARGWRLFAQFCAFLVLATVFALMLAYLTAGAGAVIVVDGPPQGDFTHPNGPNGRARLRIPLGGDIVIDSMWHTAIGGCQRIITSTLAQGDNDEGFVLTQRRHGEFFAVGQPGRHHIVRKLPDGVTPGLWHYKAEGIAICPTRTLPPVTYADFDIEIYDPEGPVVIPLAGPKLVSDTVPVGGPLAYRISYERKEAIPSFVLNTYTTVGATPTGTPDIVVERRPTAGMGVGKHTDIDIWAPLPPGVHPGRWRMRQVIVTDRPGGKTRYDPQFSVEFEVKP